MSFADHIRACNNFDRGPRRAAALPAAAASAGCGATTPRRSPASTRCSRSSRSGCALVASRRCRQRSAPRSTRSSRRCVAERNVPKWRNETFDVMARWGDKPIFRLDRGAVPFFGVRAYGVHLNGYRFDRWPHASVDRPPRARQAGRARQARQHRRRRHRQRPRHLRDARQGERGGGRHPRIRW